MIVKNKFKKLISILSHDLKPKNLQTPEFCFRSVSSMGILVLYVESNLVFKDNHHGINHFARAYEEFR